MPLGRTPFRPTFWNPPSTHDLTEVEVVDGNSRVRMVFFKKRPVGAAPSPHVERDPDEATWCHPECFVNSSRGGFGSEWCYDCHKPGALGCVETEENGSFVYVTPVVVFADRRFRRRCPIPSYHCPRVPEAGRPFNDESDPDLGPDGHVELCDFCVCGFRRGVCSLCSSTGDGSSPSSDKEPVPESMQSSTVSSVNSAGSSAAPFTPSSSSVSSAGSSTAPFTPSLP